MTADIYIYCPGGEEGAARYELEDDLEDHLGDAGEVTGGGVGVDGWNIDLKLADSQDVEQWIPRLRDFLKSAGAHPSTFFDVFPEDWEPGMAWRRVPLHGPETWLTKRPATDD